ncbi:MAG: hypothetical protein JXA03_15525 [Bacteroidales bacterium]|nr:hypothetical protein [Bacteroidales bacterium]
MAIQKEIWQNWIAENLFKDNEFLNNAVNADQYVLAGKVVHIPQAGASPGVERNRATIPATVIQRTDVDITYSLDEFTTDPVYIPHADTVELSYDKISSIMADIMGTLREKVAEWMLYHWGPATNILRTSSDNIATHLSGATGNRKKLIPADIKAVQLAMNKQNVPKENRFAILSSDLLNQLTDSLTATQYRDFSAVYDMSKGIVGQLYGFKIMERSTVLSYTNDSTPVKKAVGAAGAAADNDAGLFWHQQAVERALGDILMFENRGDATYYGDIYSALLRMGGRIRRSDEKGIYALVQAAGA